MIVLANDHLGKSLHGVLFNRLVTFAATITPEIPPVSIIEYWLNRFYANDPSIQLLVELDNSYNIVAHAVVEIQHVANAVVICCHQYQSDKPDMARLDEFIEYGRKLKLEHNAACMMFTTAKNTKAYEKRYGFKAVRTVMIDYEALERALEEGEADG
jgi:hypothetical protein